MTKIPAVKIKRLFVDIETAPNVVLAFSAGYNLTINHDAIIQERKIICIGYKWEHETTVHALRWDENQDDKKMLVEFLPIAAEADEIVGHFIDGFDLPWLQTRCLIHKLPPFPTAKTIDTKAWASHGFYFNSNKLDYISRVLGHGGKLRTDFSLWRRVLIDKDKKALDYMVTYCKIDIKRLESVFHDLKPYCHPKTHVGVLGGRDKWTCPHTGSENVEVSKKRVTALGTVQWQMRCRDNGAYYTISQKAHTDYLDHLKKKREKMLKDIAAKHTKKK